VRPLRVTVVPLRPDVPGADALALCLGCREGERRTWRLRYRLAVEEPAAELAA
jgi:hypothetical protein